MENKKLIETVEERIETMKKKDFQINVKCTQFEALTVALGATAVAATVCLIVGARKKAKLKKKITKKLEKAYAKKFAELEEEAKSVSLDSVDAFANKVKAFAYEASKNKVTEPKNEEGIMLMASPDADVKVEKDSDVFSRLSKKYK